jgi:alpha-L-fucosidase
LLDIGYYRIGYQIAGEREVELGLGWSGHFEPVAGISYTPWREQDGIQTLLMHCPWRKGGGSTYAEYRLLLPENAKARFSFGCAMLRDENVRKGSDGVTFSVLVNGEERFRKHIKSDDWEWHEIDLGDFAGKEILLRLEVNAGPKNDASWDYSLWGDPKVVIEGVTERPRLPKVRDWTLDGLSNDHALGVRPSTHYRHRNFAERIGESDFEFGYEGEDCKIAYVVRLQPGLFPALVEARIDDMPGFFPYGGGRIDGEKGPSEIVNAHVRSFDKGKLVISYMLRYDGHEYDAQSAFWIEGKTLFCEFEGEGGWVAHVNFGSPLAELRRSIFVPYLFATHVYYLPAQGAFASMFIDFTRSNGSYLDEGIATYERKTDGTRNPAYELCLFTTSYEFPEILPNIPWKPSPYLGQISDRIVFDIWGGHLAQDAEWVRELSTYGVSRAVMLKHVWQRYGYDSHLPTTVPANEQLGGEEGAIALSDACGEAGWLFALHENYIDFYPKSHEWNEREVALNPDGTMRKAWFNAGTGEQSYAYKNWAMAKYARIYSHEIHRRYRTTAGFYDVNSCAPPWLHLDYDADEKDAAMLSGRTKGNIELFGVGHEAHKGPLFGEGWQHFWWAGLVDGVEAQVDRKEWAPWVLDFDMLKIHPQQVNHGMGYWERWQEDPEGYWQGMPSPEKLDKYRAMELAFGHAGFVPTGLWHALDWVLKEYYLVRPVQARYCTSKVRRILHEVDGELVPSSIALALDLPFDRVFIEYESGLRIWVNAGDKAWEVEGRRLPKFGFLALADGLEAYTALGPNGDFAVDYCRDTKGMPAPIIFANGRAFPPAEGTICDVEPSARVERAGARKIRITYEFKIGKRNIDHVRSRDLTVFVHFVNYEIAQRPDGIVFQHDHKPRENTRDWRANHIVVDGPYELPIPEGIPDGRYEVRVGLYDASGRLRLRGEDDGSMRYGIGVVIVHGERIDFEPMEPKEPKGVKGRVNLEGEKVDFGEVITNGMVVITTERRGEGYGIAIVAHPRDEAFEIGLRVGRIAKGLGIPPDPLNKASYAIALDKSGNEVKVEIKRIGDTIWLWTLPGACRILIEDKGGGIMDAAGILKMVDEVIAQGPFQASWESLEEYRIPRWYKDAKFGIFIHWGIYSVPAFGNEWYPRNMYRQGSPEFQHHLERWGPHSKFGYKDFIPLFKAERFDPDEWADLFVEAGARYVVPVAEHHDGFAMYDCSLSEWCALKMGPKRDIIGELAEAVRKRGLIFGLSSHRAEHWWFFHPGTQFDSDVRDPSWQGFYGPAQPEGTQPDQAFLDDWLARCCELVEKYRPQVFWFDWWIEQPVFEPYLRRFAAYYYNRAVQWGLGVAINYKHRSFPDGVAVLDIERGQLADIRPLLWQTDTSVSKNSWGYIAHHEYKKAGEIIHALIDIVSKNGVLLLNIGPKPDGTIPEEEREILKEIGRWLKVNGEAIYGTRPWKVFGEGPTEVPSGYFTDTKHAAFTSQDIRFTRKGDLLYAIALGWPEDGKITIKTLAEGSVHAPLRIARIELLGSQEEIQWKRDKDGLTLFLPSRKPCDHAFAFRIRSTE